VFHYFFCDYYIILIKELLLQHQEEPKADLANDVKKKSRILTFPIRHLSNPTAPEDCDRSRKLTLADFNDCFQHLKDAQVCFRFQTIYLSDQS